MLPLIYFVIISISGAVLCSFLNKRPKAAFAVSCLVLAAGIFFTGFNLLSDSPLKAESEVFAGEFVFSTLMYGMVFLVSLAVIIVAYKAEHTKRKGTYFALILTAVAGMCGIIMTRDFFSTYVFLEVLSASSFTLIAFYNKEESTEGAIRYYYLSSIASVFILFGIAILFLTTGSTSFESLKAALDSGSANMALINTFLGIMACGFMVKTGLVPFHAWVPDAYQSASTPVSAFLGGIITKAAGAYTLIKIAMILGIASHFTAFSSVGKAIMLFGALSILAGALLAMKQVNLKRILAYSSISQMGYIFLGAGLGTPLGLAGAIFHLFNHASLKSVMFFTAASLESAAGTCNIKEIYGLEKRMPVTSIFTLIAMLSTAGIPPLAGFWSKLIIIMALWQSGFYFLAAVAIFSSVITLAYMMRVQRNVFWGKAEGNMKKVKEVSAWYLVPSGVFVVIIVAVGLYFPIIYTSFIEPIVRGLR
ncbi:multicomponent Na+:H+ antiporter subunit D [Parelusimicrobium proximum]|uniref:complex I subunit 5 family protein n=1 Tax=Parelusimicrobium proximum TaxID=3228953 RepID=UPI003D179C75